MKIIDFRFRPSTPDAVKGMLAKGGPFSPMFEYFNYKDRAKPEPIGQIVKEMEAQNVVKGVVIGRDAETTYGLKSSNPGILELMRQYPDRFIGFAGVDPIKGMDAITELKNRVSATDSEARPSIPTSPASPRITAASIPSTPSVASSIFRSSSPPARPHSCAAPSWKTPLSATSTAWPATSRI